MYHIKKDKSKMFQDERERSSQVLFSREGKGIEILRGKYTQIWRIKMKKFAFKTRERKEMGKKKRLPSVKPKLKLFITI